MNRQFGALGGLAMVMIVINHSIYFGTVYPQEWGYPTAIGWGQMLLSVLGSIGWFAVPTFLFISGSFVSYAAQGDPPQLSRKFMFSTLRRLVYPYVIWSIVFYILIYIMKNETYSLVGYIKNLLVGYPYHFVPLLVFYYLLSPVLIKVSRSYGLIVVAFIALYQLLLINILNTGTLGFTFPNWFHYLAPPIIRSTLALWGIFFPLGLVYGLTAKWMMPLSRKHFWWIAGVTVLLFILGNLDVLSMIHFPLARYLCPVAFILLLPAIRRDSIPYVRQLERIGKRSYGIYLTHLIVLNLVLIGINLLIPDLFTIYIILFPLLFIMGLFVPLTMMDWSTKSPVKQYYHFVFG